MTLRALIVDDEPAARSRLQRLLADRPEVAVIGDAADGPAAVAAILEHAPDVVFLDVQMPGMDGFEVLAALPDNTAMPLVVFATAYEQHALAAFEAEAVSYLLKPIDREQLARAVARCEQILGRRDGSDIEAELARIRSLLDRGRASTPQPIVARTSRGLRRIPLAEVVYFDGKRNFVMVHTAESSLRTDRSIRELESELPQPPFFLARRGVLVNLDRVREIQHGFRGCYVLLVEREGTTVEIAVSERQSKKLRDQLQG